MSLIFLDRDGVINTFPGKGAYVTDWKSFRFIPKAKQAIRLLSKAGFELVVVSNQGCVSRGLMSLMELETMTGNMTREIEKAGGRLGGVFYCVHRTRDGCECKKPKTGLLKRSLDGRRAPGAPVFFIGDSAEDMEAGKKAGCRTVLVLSGRSKAADAERFSFKPDFVKKDLWEAARWILRKTKKR